MHSKSDFFAGWVTPDKVFDGEVLCQEKSVLIRDGLIADIRDSIPGSIRIRGVLSPGFFDIQVNGGGGVLFNADTSIEGVRHIVEAHRQHGTTQLFPTVITDKPEVLESACQTVIDYKTDDGVAGLHIEGPHISVEKSGVHNKRHIRSLCENTLALLGQMCDHNVPVLITVAPEAVTLMQISQMTEMGVVVSLGHSNATAPEVKRCIKAGATLFTHLYNAMSPMTSREPGMVGTAINSPVYCSIICDGKHVVPEMINLAINARPRPDRMIIVSDAMPTVSGGTSFHLYGTHIKLENGTLINNNGALAGAHITMGQSIDFLMHNVGTELETCLKMAVTHPARLMGLPQLCTLVGRPTSQCIIFDQRSAATTRCFTDVLRSNSR